MKLYPTLYIALSLLGTVLSGPMEYATEQQMEIQDYDYQPDAQSYADLQRIPSPHYGNMQYYDDYQSDAQSNADTQGFAPSPYGNMQYYDDYLSDVQSYVDMQGAGSEEGEIELPAEELEELKKRMGPREMEVQEMEEFAEAELRHTVTAKNVMHGSIVAIQSNKNRYLRCPARGSGYCSTSTCPGMKMDPTDWTRCRDTVFQIYHSSKLGPIRVGDFVAFYFPADRKWFSMYRNRGHKQIQRPGYPNRIYGFHRANSWQHCGAEIFRIHADGKLDGQIIEDQDAITLYFPPAKQYLKLVAGTPVLSTCPGKYPPRPQAYDTCVTDVFEIRLR